MNDIKRQVLMDYRIEAKQIEGITNNLFKVTDHQRAYALKKSSLTEEKITNWENIYNLANTNQLQAVLPVYLTKDSKLYKKVDQTIYYLSPWIDDSRTSIDKSSIENFYNDLATIHVKTKRAQMVQAEKWNSSFLSFRGFCKETMEHLFTAVTLFEKNSYMAPIELLVCTQFREMEYALNEINKRIGQFVDIDQDEIKWNYSLCHLNLEQSHLRGTYFINWEKAGFTNGIMDLVAFFEREAKNYDLPIEKFIDSFPVYTKINELALSELHLLTIYLLNPAKYIDIIREYMDGRSRHTMISLVQELQREFRKIQFGIMFSGFVEREYETVNFDEDLD